MKLFFPELFLTNNIYNYTKMKYRNIQTLQHEIDANTTGKKKNFHHPQIGFRRTASVVCSVVSMQLIHRTVYISIRLKLTSHTLWAEGRSAFSEQE